MHACRLGTNVAGRNFIAALRQPDQQSLINS